MLNWDGFTGWFEHWSTGVVDGIVGHFTDILVSLPLYDVVRFVLALFGVEFSL